MTTATVEDVRALMVLPAGDTTDLQPHLDAAELIVTEELANTNMSVDRLRLISIHLAAHFAVLAVERGGITRTQVGTSSEEYRNAGLAYGRGIMLTRYGQQAVMLDISGTLALNASPGVKAEFRVV